MNRTSNVAGTVAILFSGLLMTPGTAVGLSMELYNDFGGARYVAGQNTFTWGFDLSAYNFLTDGDVTINSAILEVWAQSVDTNANIPSDVTWGTSHQYYSGNLADLLVGEADSGSTPLMSPLTTLSLLPGDTTFAYLQDGAFLAEVHVNETNNWRVVGSNTVGHWESYISGQRWVSTWWGGYYVPVWSQRWVYDYTNYFYNPSYDGSLTLLNSRLLIDYTLAPAPVTVPVPEPASLTLVAVGLLGLAVRGRRRIAGS